MTSTDAQITDFGMGRGVRPDQHLFVQTNNKVSDQTQVFNNTPEPSTGYGPLFYRFGKVVDDRKVKPRSVAKNPRGGGLRATNGAIQGSKTMGYLAGPIDEISKPRVGSTDKQNENSRRRFYVGQL